MEYTRELADEGESLATPVPGCYQELASKTQKKNNKERNANSPQKQSFAEFTKLSEKFNFYYLKIVLFLVFCASRLRRPFHINLEKESHFFSHLYFLILF